MSEAERPLISLIVAMAQNGVIGRDNALPWRLPEDLKRFKEFTLGKPILMGRKTFEAIGRPLPGRANLVLTRDRDWRAPGVIPVHSVEEALLQTRTCDELVAIGGAEIYRLLLPLAGHTEAVVGVAFSPDGKRLATASSDRSAKLWDVETGLVV